MTYGFTRKSHLALHVVVQIAENPPGTRLALIGVAGSVGVSADDLLPIVSKLARAGIVLVGRGAYKEVQLARLAETLTILDVVEAVEGQIRANLGHSRKLPGRSRVKQAYDRAAKSFRRALGKVRISDLRSHPETLN